MNTSHLARRRLDVVSVEMIVVVILITLHDLLLSNTLLLPLVLRHSTLAQLRTLDIVASGLEFWVPTLFSFAMLTMWMLGRAVWVRRVAVVFLSWVTIRLVVKVALVVYIIVSQPQSGVGVLLKDVIVMWLVNFLLFGVWYWIIDGGGPDARRYQSLRRYDLDFPNARQPCQGGRAGNRVFWTIFTWGSRAVRSLAWVTRLPFPSRQSSS